MQSEACGEAPAKARLPASALKSHLSVSPCCNQRRFRSRPGFRSSSAPLCRRVKSESETRRTFEFRRLSISPASRSERLLLCIKREHRTEHWNPEDLTSLTLLSKPLESLHRDAEKTITCESVSMFCYYTLGLISRGGKPFTFDVCCIDVQPSFPPGTSININHILPYKSPKEKTVHHRKTPKQKDSET